MNDRSLRIGLIVSIILNVFLVGGIAGGLAFWRLNPHIQAGAPPAAGGQPRRALRFAADDLGPQQQRQFRRALRQARIDALPSARQGQARRRELIDLIGAQPFDRSAVMQALSDARAADAAVRARLETAVVDYAAGLSAQDRTVFVRGLARTSTLRQPAPREKARAAATETRAPER